MVQKFNNLLQRIAPPKIVTEDEIIDKYSKDHKIITKHSFNLFGKKILKLENIHIVKLDHEDLLFLKVKNLLANKQIKPLYFV